MRGARVDTPWRHAACGAVVVLAPLGLLVHGVVAPVCLAVTAVALVLALNVACGILPEADAVRCEVGLAPRTASKDLALVASSVLCLTATASLVGPVVSAAASAALALLAVGRLHRRRARLSFADPWDRAVPAVAADRVDLTDGGVDAALRSAVRRQAILDRMERQDPGLFAEWLAADPLAADPLAGGPPGGRRG